MKLLDRINKAVDGYVKNTNKLAAQIYLERMQMVRRSPCLTMFQLIRELERNINKLVAQKPPGGLGVLSLSWIMKDLSDEDFDLMEAMEKAYGKDRCNQWLCSVLDRTGSYQRDGLEHVHSTLKGGA